MYAPLSSHQAGGRAGKARPSPGGGAAGRGRAVGPPANRNAAPLRNTYGGRTSIPATAGRLPIGNRSAINDAVRRAIPASRAVGSAAGAVVNALLDEQLAAIDEAIQEANEWLHQGSYQEPQTSLHPQLQYTNTITGTGWGVAPGYYLRESFPFTMATQVGGPPVDTLQASQNPDTYGYYGWASEQVSPLTGGRLGLPRSPGIWVRTSTSLRRYTRRIDLYKNTNPSKPVTNPWVITPPYVQPMGVPVPSSVPWANPHVRPQAQTRPIPRPRSNPEEVFIDLHPDHVAVYEGAPKPPRGPTRETKFSGRGKAAAVAAAALWAFEAVRDWRDWLDILTAAHTTMPHRVKRSSRIERLAWLRDNPHTLSDVDWGGVVAGLIGWAVDEQIGRAMGQAQQGAHSRLNTGNPVSSVYGTPGRPIDGDPYGGVIGSSVADYVRPWFS